MIDSSAAQKFRHMISYPNLLRCWGQFSKGKKKRPDLIAFERDLRSHLTQLSQELRSGTYKHGPYSHFWVSEPKMRRISRASVRDRIVHHMLAEVLNVVYKKRFIFHSYASIKGKGTHQGVIDLQKIIYKATQNDTKPCYFLKCDIKKFFDTASQDLMLKILQKHIQSQPLLDLLSKIIYSPPQSNPASPHVGFPIGNLTSQVFSNIYMNELDHYVKHRLKVPHYLRYTDDFLLLSPDKSFLIQCLEDIRVFLQDQLCLTLHPQKITLSPYTRGIDWLGYNLFFDHRLLRTKTKRRLVQRLHTRLSSCFEREITLSAVRQTAFSYLGMLCHATEHTLSVDVARLLGIRLPGLKRKKDLFFLRKFRPWLRCLSLFCFSPLMEVFEFFPLLARPLGFRLVPVRRFW